MTASSIAAGHALYRPPLRNGHRSRFRCRAASTTPSAVERAAILSEALPYLQRFSGQTLVIKYGGAALASDSAAAGWLGQQGL